MNKDLYIGIDVGGTRTKYGIIDVATSEVIKSRIMPTEKEDASIFLGQVCKLINDFRRLAMSRQDEVLGVGIGIPGFTTAEGFVLTTYGALHFMENYPLISKLAEYTTLPLAMDNDARIVCLGEALFGKGIGYKRVLSLTLGTGVGFGFVANGKFSDALPLAHMGGNMVVTNEGAECYCGKKGCLEALVSSSGILQLAQEQPGIPKGLTVEEIFSAAASGHAAALTVVEKVCGYLHTAIHNYTNLFAPDIIVLGGGIAKSLSPYIHKIKGRSYMGPYPGYDFDIAVSDLQESAGMLGAAAFVHQLITTQTTVE